MFLIIVAGDDQAPFIVILDEYEADPDAFQCDHDNKSSYCYS